MKKYWDKINDALKNKAVRKIKPLSLPARSKNKVYIFFTVTGMFYMLVFSLLLLVAINYNNNIAIAGICFLIVLEVYSIFKNYFILKKITFKNIIQHPCIEGDKMYVDILFEFKKNRSNLYPLVNIKINKDEFFINPDENAIATVRWDYDTKNAGVFAFPIIELSTAWPFGMSKSWMYVKVDKNLAIIPYENIAFNKSMIKEEEEVIQKQTKFGDVSGVRIVNKNEKDVKISWKHTLKHLEPITYTWEKGEESVLIIHWPTTKNIAMNKLRLTSSLAFGAIEKSIPFKIIHPSFKTMQINDKENALKSLHDFTLHVISPSDKQMDYEK